MSPEAKEIRIKLIELARLHTTWSYSQLNDQLQLRLNFNYESDRQLIGEWLEEVSRSEWNKKRPVVSCLITRKHIRINRADGFCKLYKELAGKNRVAKQDMRSTMIDECYQFWQNADNYKNFRNDF